MQENQYRLKSLEHQAFPAASLGSKVVDQVDSSHHRHPEHELPLVKIFVDITLIFIKRDALNPRTKQKPPTNPIASQSSSKTNLDLSN